LEEVTRELKSTLLMPQADDMLGRMPARDDPNELRSGKPPGIRGVGFFGGGLWSETVTILLRTPPKMPPEQANPDDLLREAKSGREASLGALLDLYRHYLKLLARVEIGKRLQAKADASDLVQETFLEAHRNFPLFQGDNERQFLAWIRQILAARVANLVRHYVGTQGRDIRLEQELAADLDQSSQLLDGSLVSGCSSPSQEASRREQAVLLADALAKLPDNYREVIVLRHLEGLTFPEAADRMGKTLNSVEKLWVRALARLRQTFGGE